MPSELRSQTQASSTLSFNEILDNKTLRSSSNATSYTNKCFIHLQQPSLTSMSNIISLNETFFFAKLNDLRKHSLATPPPNHAACQWRWEKHGRMLNCVIFCWKFFSNIKLIRVKKRKQLRKINSTQIFIRIHPTTWDYV